MTFLYWLFRRKNYEIKIIFATLAVLIALPIASVVVVASSGVSAVSSAVAAVNPVTHIVELFDPNGNKIHELKLTTVWPTRGYVSDEFGAYEKFRQEAGFGPHTGIDIANEYGVPSEPVTPFIPGKVIAVHRIDDNTCGIYVKIQHDYNITSLYCHLMAATAIEQDDVKPGDTIGLMGKTGAATGPHLHFQVYVYGVLVNPRVFLVGQPERSTVRGILPNF